MTIPVRFRIGPDLVGSALFNVAWKGEPANGRFSPEVLIRLPMTVNFPVERAWSLSAALGEESQSPHSVTLHRGDVCETRGGGRFVVYDYEPPALNPR